MDQSCTWKPWLKPYRLWVSEVVRLMDLSTSPPTPRRGSFRRLPGLQVPRQVHGQALRAPRGRGDLLQSQGVLLGVEPQPQRKGVETYDTVDERNPSRTTLQPRETIVCWHFLGNHHSRDSEVVQDFIYPTYQYVYIYIYKCTFVSELRMYTLLIYTYICICNDI